MTDTQLYCSMKYALLLHPLAPSATSWSPSLPEGGNQIIDAGVCSFVMALSQCQETGTATVLFFSSSKVRTKKKCRLLQRKQENTEVLTATALFCLHGCSGRRYFFSLLVFLPAFSRTADDFWHFALTYRLQDYIIYFVCILVYPFSSSDPWT